MRRLALPLLLCAAVATGGCYGTVGYEAPYYYPGYTYPYPYYRACPDHYYYYRGRCYYGR